MLKDLFKKKDKDLKETIAKSLMDGYVDIKAYRHDKNGNKIMVYHDTGDNTITDWMRHAIMLMLSGYSLSFNGNKTIDGISNLQKTKTKYQNQIQITIHRAIIMGIIKTDIA